MNQLFPDLAAPRLTVRGCAILAGAHLLLAAFYAANVTWESSIAFESTFPRSLVDASLKVVLTLPVWFVIVVDCPRLDVNDHSIRTEVSPVRDGMRIAHTLDEPASGVGCAARDGSRPL